MGDARTVRLEAPWAGFSCLHIGDFKIGIAITDENGTQDPERAGLALESFVEAANQALSGEGA